MPADSLDQRTASFRRFNRFYTRKIGVLEEGLLHTPFSLTEARILFEIAHRGDLTASALCRELGLDAGYLSRILGRLGRQGLVERELSPGDGRQRRLSLTEAGKGAFTLVDQRSQVEASGLLATLSDAEQQRLLTSMQAIENLIEHKQGSKVQSQFLLREPRPGDLGWVVHRHGALYAQEYGWDQTFEALVAQIVADFVTYFKPGRERAWIAEMDGQIVGSVFVVEKDEMTAKLRLLLVEPETRGLGLGKRLVQECIDFAQASGYHKLVLWTNSVLQAARAIYRQAGFTLVETEAHHSFGHDLVSETWEKAL